MKMLMIWKNKIYINNNVLSIALLLC
jgi:hypothetical protein